MAVLEVEAGLVLCVVWCVPGDVFMPEPSRDDPVSPFGGQYSYVVGVGNQRIASQTQAAAEDDHFVLTLGGDHSVAMGSIGCVSVYL